MFCGLLFCTVPLSAKCFPLQNFNFAKRFFTKFFSAKFHFSAKHSSSFLAEGFLANNFEFADHFFLFISNFLTDDSILFVFIGRLLLD